MSAGANGARRAMALFRQSSNLDRAVCRSCQETLHRRGYATAATSSTTVQTDVSPPSDLTTSAPSIDASPKPNSLIKVGAVLSRPPRITRELTPFEKAFYFYQRRLNERLALPFTRYFYYQKGTPADVQWKQTIKERQTASRDIGKYNAYSPDAWNDELLVGAAESEPEHQINALIHDAEGYLSSESLDGVAKKEELPRPLPRMTKADLEADYKSLDRLLHRTLYLLVQVKEGYWKFPSANIKLTQEDLVSAANRALRESAGPNMNTWTVGNHPIGHFIHKRRISKESEAPPAYLTEKTFFLKGRIMAGQADIKDNRHFVTDFKWLSKEEIQKHVIPPYWSSIKNMLSER